MHVLMINYGDVLGLLKKMRANGRPCPVITLVGPGELNPEEIKRDSPETTIIMRVYYPDDGGLKLNAAEYFWHYVEPFPPRKVADYHQINNEVNVFEPWTVLWWMDQMRWAEEHGYKLAVPSWSAGNPPDMNVWQRPDVLDMLRHIRDKGHLLALHEYDLGYGDWTLLRFIRHVYPTLPADLQANMPKVAFTEFGEHGAHSWDKATALAKLRAWQAVLAPYPWIVGASVWTVGNTGTEATESWVGDDWAGQMEALVEL